MLLYSWMYIVLSSPPSAPAPLPLCAVCVCVLTTASFPNAFSTQSQAQLQQAAAQSPAGKQTEGKSPTTLAITLIAYSMYVILVASCTWGYKAGYTLG